MSDDPKYGFFEKVRVQGNARVLIGGSLVMGFAYLLIGPTDLDNAYLLYLPIEAALYTCLVLYALRIEGTIRWLAVATAAAVLNTLNLWVLPFLLGGVLRAIEVVFSLHLDLGSLILPLMSSLAGVLFAALLDLSLPTDSITRRTYALCAVLCLFAGLGIGVSVAVHKALWWLMFSVALIQSGALMRRQIESVRASRVSPDPAAASAVAGSPSVSDASEPRR
ncbi:MAG: hypothetical protein AAFQ62_15925 [Pseudomonadota bacterium]